MLKITKKWNFTEYLKRLKKSDTIAVNGGYDMKRIMFVCHGNICRSPMAEFIFTELVRRRGLDMELCAESSATSTEEIWRGVGNPIYPPAEAELRRQGIPYSRRRAVQLKREDLDRCDLFVGMDSANIRNIYRILGEGANGKVYKLLDFTPRGGDVADPWYSDRFDIAYRDIYEGCEALLEYLTTKADKKA